MIQHVTNSQCHVGYVKETEPLLEALSEGIYKTKKCQNDARNIWNGVEELCNIRWVNIVLLTTLDGRCNRTPKAWYSICHNSIFGFVAICRHQCFMIRKMKAYSAKYLQRSKDPIKERNLLFPNIFHINLSPIHVKPIKPQNKAKNSSTSPTSELCQQQCH